MQSFLCETNAELRSIVRTAVIKRALLTLACTTIASLMLATLPLYDVRHTPVTLGRFFCLAPLLSLAFVYGKHRSRRLLSLLMIGFAVLITVLFVEHNGDDTAALNRIIFPYITNKRLQNLVAFTAPALLIASVVVPLLHVTLRTGRRYTFSVLLPHRAFVGSALVDGLWKLCVPLTIVVAMTWYVLPGFIQLSSLLICEDLHYRIDLKGTIMYIIVQSILNSISANLLVTLMRRPLEQLEDPRVLVSVLTSATIHFGARGYGIMLRSFTDVLQGLSHPEDLYDDAGDTDAFKNAATRKDKPSVRFTDKPAGGEDEGRAGGMKPESPKTRPMLPALFSKRSKKSLQQKDRRGQLRYQQTIDYFSQDDIYVLHQILNACSRVTYTADVTYLTSLFNTSVLAKEAARLSDALVAATESESMLARAKASVIRPVHIFSTEGTDPSVLLYFLDFVVFLYYEVSARYGLASHEYFRTTLTCGKAKPRLSQADIRNKQIVIGSLVQIQRRFHNILASPIQDRYLNTIGVPAGALQYLSILPEVCGPEGTLGTSALNTSLYATGNISGLNASAVDDQTGQQNVGKAIQLLSELQNIFPYNNDYGIMMDDQTEEALDMNPVAIRSVEYAQPTGFDAASRKGQQKLDYRSWRTKKLAFVIGLLFSEYTIEEFLANPALMDEFTLHSLLAKLRVFLFGEEGKIISVFGLWAAVRGAILGRGARRLQRQSCARDADVIAHVADMLSDLVIAFESSGAYYEVNEIISMALKAQERAVRLYMYGVLSTERRLRRSEDAQFKSVMRSLRLTHSRLRFVSVGF